MAQPVRQVQGRAVAVVAQPGGLAVLAVQVQGLRAVQLGVFLAARAGSAFQVLATSAQSTAAAAAAVRRQAVPGQMALLC